MPIKRNFDSYFTEIQATASTVNNTARKSYKIENAFTPVYKDGKFSVVLRFLPSHPDETKPFIANKTHMFKLPNDSWFGCDCLSKFGLPCPICEYNRDQFKKFGKEEGKQRSFGKARDRYVSNILIVKNPNAPETEGKVFRFEYGAQIMKLLAEAMTDHEDPEAGMINGFNPFDWKNGANFVYEGVQGSNGPKLDSSHFGPQRPINRWDAASKQFIDLTDSEIDVIESNLYTLDEYDHKKDEVKDYQQILEFFEKKAGYPLFENAGSAASPATSVAAASAPSFADMDIPMAPAPKAAPAAPAPAAEVTDTDDFFARLAD